ncbi:MAG: thiol peroxidase [Bacteroidales bacterium]
MKKNYGVVTFVGSPMTLLGEIIKVGDIAPDFMVIDSDLNTIHLRDFKGKTKVISVVPSIDTGICDLQTRRFNQEALKRNNVVFFSISCDLPFALKRYGNVTDVDNIILASDYKDTDFGLKYGLLVEELRLLARSIIILDKNNKVKYVEIVNEVASHPNYELALPYI